MHVGIQLYSYVKNQKIYNTKQDKQYVIDWLLWVLPNGHNKQYIFNHLYCMYIILYEYNILYIPICTKSKYTLFELRIQDF